MCGDIAAVRRFLENEPNLLNERRPFLEDTPLGAAAFGGQVDMVTYLLEKHADINAVDGLLGNSPLVIATLFNGW